MASTCRHQSERAFTRCVAARCIMRALRDQGGFSSRHVVVRVNDPTEAARIQRLPPSCQHRRGGRDRRQRHSRRSLSAPSAMTMRRILTCTWSFARERSSRSAASIRSRIYRTATRRTFPRRCPIASIGSTHSWRRVFFSAPTASSRATSRRVEVDLRRGTRVLTTRVVDFDDKSTIVEGKGDPSLRQRHWRRGIPEVQHGRAPPADLAYGSAGPEHPEPM